MTNQALVTIVIPCYNYGKFLQDAVGSVLAQSYSHWECLIVDDGSTDNTRQIAESLCAADRRVSYHYKTNGGLSSARNFGIGLAKGDYLCFLDTDDLLDPKKLESQLACFNEDPKIDIVYGSYRFFETNAPKVLYTSKNKEKTEEHPGFSGSGKELLPILVRNNITVVSAPLLKRQVVERVGVFDETYRSYEDWHFWLRCAMKNCYFRFCEQPAVCTYIRFGHESMMSNKQKMLRASLQLRSFLQSELPPQLKVYNAYRRLRSRLKLLFI